MIVGFVSIEALIQINARPPKSVLARAVRVCDGIFNIWKRGDFMRSYVKYMIAALAAPAMFAASGALAQDAAGLQKQIDQVKSVLPKFAIPMREVGDRFQNMYFAAKDGNWALAAYM